MFDVVILIVTPNLTQGEFDALVPMVSPEKQVRIKKCRLFRDAQNCLLGDVLARAEICRIANLDNRALDFSANAYGKPFLANKPDIHFNISHTKNYVACALSDEPVGIDIEFIKPTNQKIAERFFAPDERAYIAANDQANDQMNAFYEVWTKKESRIKWEGQGLHKPLSSFSVFEVSQDGQKQAIYHKVYQNAEVICHVCSTKQAAPNVEITDTAAFVNPYTGSKMYPEPRSFVIV